MVFGSVLPKADLGNTTSGSTNETVPRSDGELAEEQAYDLTDKFGQAIARTATVSSGVSSGGGRGIACLLRQTLESSFSAVSKPNFASKYSLESSRRDLHNALLCTVL